MKVYKTSEVAKIINVHSNTVRLYEDLELIPKAKRLENNYRVFEKFHIEQMKLAREAFKVEIVQNGLRKKIVEIIKLSSNKKFDEAILLTKEYLEKVKYEEEGAKEAVKIVENILKDEEENLELYLKKKEASEYLDISPDTLRNWERNGLLKAKKKENGYRIYDFKDIQRLKIIRTLRFANYSLQSILNMLNKLEQNRNIKIDKILDSTPEAEGIKYVCDNLMTALKKAGKTGEDILIKLEEMKKEFK